MHHKALYGQLKGSDRALRVPDIASFLLGHQQLQTTMVYIDITLEQELEALATLEDENDKKVSKKWKTGKGGLADFCGVKPMKM